MTLLVMKVDIIIILLVIWVKSEVYQIQYRTGYITSYSNQGLEPFGVPKMKIQNTGGIRVHIGATESRITINNMGLKTIYNLLS